MNKLIRKLIFSLTKKDFQVDYYRGSGAGGQNRNKRDTCVRITHPESGAVGECCEERSQLQNKRTAFRRLVDSPKFQIWHKKRVGELLISEAERQEIERRVDDWMKEENLKIEYL